ncbi:MAG: hypothetical protein RI554_07745 [Trueperaceae bacterium]|nr:hypothetical protein [Trueperaceae bacterium]
MTRPRPVTPSRPTFRALVALAALVLPLSACTGTQETRTPVALLVGGTPDDGASGAIDVVATNLPRPPGDAPPPLAAVDGFRVALPGPVTALEVREDGGRIYALYRDGADRVAVFDATALDLADPASLVRLRTLDLGARVAAALPGFDGPDALCATGLAVAADGDWVGVTHDARACGDATGVPEALLIEARPDGTRAFASVGSDDAPATPAFAVLDGRERFAWVTRGASAAVRTRALDAPADVTTFADLGPYEDATGLGVGGSGLVVLEDDALLAVAADDGARSAEWRTDDDATFTGVVDLGPRSGRAGSGAAYARTPRGIAFVRDVGAEASDAAVVQGSAFDPRDATVGPYDYLYVARRSEVVAFDLLTLAGLDPDADVLRAAHVGALDDLEARAVAWTFARDGRAPQAE